MAKNPKWIAEYHWSPEGRTGTWTYTVRKTNDGWYDVGISFGPAIIVQDVSPNIIFPRLTIAKKFCEKLHKKVLDEIDEKKIRNEYTNSLRHDELARQFGDSGIVKKVCDDLGIDAPWMTTKEELKGMPPIGSA